MQKNGHAAKILPSSFRLGYQRNGRRHRRHQIITTGKNEAGTQWPGMNCGLTPQMDELEKKDGCANAYVRTMETDLIDNLLEKMKRLGAARKKLSLIICEK